MAVSQGVRDRVAIATQNQIKARKPTPPAAPTFSGYATSAPGGFNGDPGYSRSAPAGFTGDAGYSMPTPGGYKGDPGYSRSAPGSYKGDPGYSSAIAGLRSNVMGGSQPSTVADTLTQPRSRTDQTLDRLSGMTESEMFQYKAPTPFSYDQNTDPAYQAALASARANITQQQADTNGQLRATGQGKSSYSETVANQIGAKEMGRVSTDVLPQLISQAYQRYSDTANRDMQTQQANYGVQRDRVGDLGDLYGLQNQQDFSNPLAESQVTGSYLPGEARQYIDTILGLKQQAEAPGVTPEARAGLSRKADAYRAALQGMGIDPSGFGADVNAGMAAGNRNGAGIQTLERQGFDANQRQQNLAAALSVGAATGRNVTPQTDYAGLIRQAADPNTSLNLAGQNQQLNSSQTIASLTGMFNGQPTTDEQQRQLTNLWAAADRIGAIPDELAAMYGLPKGMPTQQAMEFAANFNQGAYEFGANYGLAQDDNDRQWSQLDYNMSQDANSPEKYQGLSPTQVLDNVRTNYTEPILTPSDPSRPADPKINPMVESGKRITTDANKRYQMFLDVIDSNLPGGTTAEDQILLSLGMSKKEISGMEQRYQEEEKKNPKG